MLSFLDRLTNVSTLSEEESLLVKTVRAMAQNKIAARAAAYDKTGDFPWDNVDDINALGLNGMFVPEQYGGTPTSYRAYLSCVREISAACAATGIIWATNFHAMKPVITFGSETLKTDILPAVAQGALASLCITEPEAGSDATAMKTRFTEDGDTVIVDGGKTFITNGGVADYYLVFGKWSSIESPRKSLSAIVIPKDTRGLTAGPKEDKMGIRASATSGLNFDNCRVPRSYLLGDPGDGLTILLASLNTSRPSVAAHALGIARSAFEDAVSYVNERRQSGRKIAEFQGVQFLLADLAAELALCESWLWHVADCVETNVPDYGVEASILKLRASDLAMRMATEAVQLHGGYGYITEYRVERLMRDAKICQIWEGTNQVHRQVIGRSLIQK